MPHRRSYHIRENRHLREQQLASEGERRPRQAVAKEGGWNSGIGTRNLTCNNACQEPTYTTREGALNVSGQKNMYGVLLHIHGRGKRVALHSHLEYDAPHIFKCALDTTNVPRHNKCLGTEKE